MEEEIKLGIGSALGQSATLWLKNILRFGSLSVVIQLPLLLLIVADVPLGPVELAPLLRWALSHVFSLLAQAAIVYALVERLDGRRASFTGSILVVIDRLAPLLALGAGLAVVEAVIEGLLFLLGADHLGSLLLEAIVATIGFVAVPAVVVEKRGAFAAFRRSAALSRLSPFRLLATILVVGVVAILGPVAAIGLASGRSISLEHLQLARQLVDVPLISPLWAVTTVVVYKQLRASPAGTGREVADAPAPVTRSTLAGARVVSGAEHLAEDIVEPRPGHSSSALPDRVLERMRHLNHAASSLTKALFVALFIPIVLLYVVGAAAYRIRQCSKLRASYPEIDRQLRALGRQSRGARRALARSDADASCLLQFKQAGLGFWVLLATPLLYVGFLVAVIAVVAEPEPTATVSPTEELAGLVARCDGGEAQACVEASLRLDVPGATEAMRRQTAALERRGCELGDGLGCNNFGASVANGIGVPRDIAKAVTYFERGCALGETYACSQFAGRLIEGRGVARDRARGIEILERTCAVPDSLYACHRLADELAMSDDPAERRRAVPLYERACRAGSSLACYRAGELGSSIEVSRPVAARELAEASRSCAADIGAGCNKAAQFYDLGIGVAPDRSAWLRYQQKGCELRYPASCEALARDRTKVEREAIEDAAEGCRRQRPGASCARAGFALLYGKGIEADPEAGLALLRFGCDDARDGSSCYELGRAYGTGVGVATNREQALALVRRGCKLGNGPSCDQAGRMLWADGGRRNRREAHELFQFGCAFGDRDCCARAQSLPTE